MSRGKGESGVVELCVVCVQVQEQGKIGCKDKTQSRKKF